MFGKGLTTMAGWGLWISFAFTALPANAETVMVRSGNGSVGQRDNEVTFLLGPPNSDFGAPFLSADFLNAQNGPAALIVSPNPLWISGLNEDTSAKWIGTNPNSEFSGNTALYAVPFLLTNAFSSATLTLHYAADDTLAFEGFGGIFLNGTAVCTSLIQIGFSREHTLTCNNVGSLLQKGANWMYFDVVNLEAGSGLLFSATITTTDIVVPSINPGGVVNAASSVPGAVAPGRDRKSVV